jgi:hypothetical protein
MYHELRKRGTSEVRSKGEAVQFLLLVVCTEASALSVVVSRGGRRRDLRITSSSNCARALASPTAD